MDIYAQMATKIIEAQEAIIGSVAVERARRVSGLRIDWAKHEVSIDGNEVAAIDQLIAQYKELFGQISVEVCKESVTSLVQQINPNKLPKTLK